MNDLRYGLQVLKVSWDAGIKIPMSLYMASCWISADDRSVRRPSRQLTIEQLI